MAAVQTGWSEAGLLESVFEKHNYEGSELIAVLQDLQEKLGFLSETALMAVSKALDIPLSRVYQIATFYPRFHLEPRGRVSVRVCTGLACQVRGADRVLERLKRELGVEVGGTTADRMFHLDTVRCLGCCGQAPVVSVGDRVSQGSDPNVVRDLLDEGRTS